MTPPRTVHLLRHGTTVRPGRWLGHADVAVSAEGIADCVRAAAAVTFTHIVTSDLSRAADCATAIAAARAEALARVESPAPNANDPRAARAPLPPVCPELVEGHTPTTPADAHADSHLPPIPARSEPLEGHAPTTPVDTHAVPHLPPSSIRPELVERHAPTTTADTHAVPHLPPSSIRPEPVGGHAPTTTADTHAGPHLSPSSVRPEPVEGHAPRTTACGEPIHHDPRWRELDFGDWDDADPATLDPATTAAFWQDPDANPPLNGERWSDLVTRVGEALATLEDATLVVTHGGVIRAALAAACGFDARQVWAFDLPCAALVTLRLWPDAAQIVRLSA